MNNSNDIYKNLSYLRKTTPIDLAIKNPPHKKDFQQNNNADYTPTDFLKPDWNEDADTLSYLLFI